MNTNTTNAIEIKVNAKGKEIVKLNNVHDNYDEIFETLNLEGLRKLGKSELLKIVESSYRTWLDDDSEYNMEVEKLEPKKKAKAVKPEIAYIREHGEESCFVEAFRFMLENPNDCTGRPSQKLFKEYQNLVDGEYNLTLDERNKLDLFGYISSKYMKKNYPNAKSCSKLETLVKNYLSAKAEKALNESLKGTEVKNEQQELKPVNEDIVFKAFEKMLDSDIKCEDIENAMLKKFPQNEKFIKEMCTELLAV